MRRPFAGRASLLAASEAQLPDAIRERRRPHAEAIPGSRSREYPADDVERLVSRQAARRDPSSVARSALDVHGMPVLSSGLTLIDAGRLLYRGRDALELARTQSLEQVAALLWDAPLREAEVVGARAASRRRLAGLPFIERCHAYLAEVGPKDAAACHLEAPTVRRVGGNTLRGLAALAVDADGQAEANVAELLGLG